MFGVGRSTVREAYRMMQALGTLEVRRGKGVYFIGFPDENKQDAVGSWFKEHAQTLSDYMEVRSAIENHVDPSRPLNGPEKRIFEALEEIQRSFIELGAKKHKQSTMAFYDQEFHHKIATMHQK